ncbi:uncharacterized protein K02A2.6-like [Ornithodoros turicata]|uniref:uncharacterized protein K02A2.6-like n=1 Tax=Ornithodoros turicata TaxID=34597 RepID=UPI00313875C8
MPVYGNIEQFDGDASAWTDYRDRIQQYFEANNVAQDKQRAVFLTCCGKQTYTLLRSLLAPAAPSATALPAILEALDSHYSPKPSQVVARYKFNTRVRQEGEAVSDFIAALNRLSDDCEFGTFRDSMLRDRIVCGINDAQMQTRLLEVPDLTLAIAKKTVVAIEAARNDSRTLSTQSEGTAANFVKNKSTGITCYRCGEKHLATQCRHRNTVCHSCGKKGHLAKVCQGKANKKKEQVEDKKKSDKKKPVHAVEDPSEDEEEATSVSQVFDLWNASDRSDPFRAHVVLDGVPLEMELDTGAGVSIIGENVLRKVLPHAKLETSNVLLRSYSGELTRVRGCVNVQVKFREKQECLPLYVAPGSCPNLFGRTWMKAFGMALTAEDTHVCVVSTVEDVIAKHQDVFSDTLGTLKDVTAKLQIQDGARPRFFKARAVPFALQDRVAEELQRMQREGIIEPVKTSEWAAPIVPVVKRDGRVRICGDLKITVNPVAVPERYPIARVEELFAKLSGGKKFSKLDLKDAYQQILLDEESKNLVTINTQKGLYRYVRLPFGVSTAPALFQRIMENLLQDLRGVVVYFDDILVTGKDDDDHKKNLDIVLRRLEEAGLRLKLEKCIFMAPRVHYLGYVITEAGLHPDPKKVEAVTKAPAPTNVKTLQSYLGLVNYYRKFLPDLSTVLHPLNKLLGANAPWTWGTEQQLAFQKSKDLLTSARVLAHFDPKKPLVLVCDASPYGVGAVLAHRELSGEELPIAYASRSLMPAECNYSQLDKEALAVIFGVLRFHQYLWGHSFEIVTDHKPLLGLLAHDKPVPNNCSPRLLRWALTLSSYRYELVYRQGSRIAHADGLSRLPLPTEALPVERPAEVFLLEGVYPTVLSAKVVAQATSRDVIASNVRHILLSGGKLPDVTNYRPYQRRFDQLSVQDDCILLGNRVVIPQELRAKVLDLLHESHPGVTKMKAVARSHVWWDTLDEDIAARVQRCMTCQEQQRESRRVPMTPWPFPERAWSRLHVDFAGPFKDHYIFILVDAFSKWVEAEVVPSPSAEATISCLRSIFARHGLPDLVVSDNGPAFVSAKYTEFLKRNGVRKVLIPPYHPASNGAAERVVQTIKNKLKKASIGDFKTQLSRALFSYRTTPHEITGASPAELLCGRKLRTALDNLHPDMRTAVLPSIVLGIQCSQEIFDLDQLGSLLLSQKNKDSRLLLYSYLGELFPRGTKIIYEGMHSDQNHHQTATLKQHSRSCHRVYHQLIFNLIPWRIMGHVQTAAALQVIVR